MSKWVDSELENKSLANYLKILNKTSIGSDQTKCKVSFVE